MKKLIFVLCVLMGTSVFAADDGNPESDDAKVTFVKNGNVIKVFYRSEERVSAKISIVNSEGRKIFTELVKNENGFIRPYNLASLQAGIYTISVSDKSGVYEEQISVKTEKELMYRVARMPEEKGKYVLSIPASNVGKVNVSIYHEDGTLLYDREEEVYADFAKIYNLKKIQGEVSFIVSPR